MRNLKLVNVYKIKDPCLQEAKGICIDDSQELIYFVTFNSIYKLGKDSEVIFCTQFNNDVDQNEFVKIEFLIEKQSFVISLGSGDILLFDTVSNVIECVGSISDGIRDMNWSPDQELVVFLTGEDNFILMTKEFDPVTENYINSDDFGENKPISVGWGSKETQFDIKKPAPKLKEDSDQLEFCSADKSPKISWRGDGQFFAISTVDVAGVRRLRIWNREGILQFTSEKISGLEQTLHWRPSGNLITSTRQYQQKHEVVFFEKNGLQHGEFVLPYAFKEFCVKEVHWNINSSVLVVWGHTVPSKSNDIQYHVSLWTCSNYHWYSKYNIYFKNCVKIVQWDPQDIYKLHVVCSNGEYVQYKWVWTTTSSYGQSQEDCASVAVIDGRNALITPFRSTVVPPPMCAFSFLMPYTIENIVFAPSPHSNDFAICLSNSKVAVVKMHSTTEHIDNECELKVNLPNLNITKHCTLHNLVFNSEEPVSPLFHWTWGRGIEEKLFFISSMENKISLFYIILTNEKDLIAKHCTKIEENVICVHSNEVGNILAIQLNSGNILKYDCMLDTLNPWLVDGKQIKFPYICPTMVIGTVGQQEVIFGLTQHFQLYCNNSEIASSCTSFHVGANFLLYTTYQHTLHCISLESFSNIHNSTNHTKDGRLVERGSRLVTHISADTKVILQMPRGNLEVIHPRMILISILKKLLNQLQFGITLDLMWKHRINMSLIYNHNPTAFLQNIKQFVQQVKEVSKLNIFLADISNALVGESNQKLHDNGERATEVNVICDSLRNSLIELDAEYYLLPILATYARKSKPELDLALQKIKSVREEEKIKKPLVTSDEALKFLLYMVDVNNLYDVALGTYDFDIILMVAEKSNKDPKEYLPFLNELQSLEINYRKYKIDVHLQDYKKALHNISKCKDHFDECIALITSQRLYKDALHLFPCDSEEAKQIWSLYGDYLMEKRYHEEAGLVYKRCGKLERALTSFQLCGNWNLMVSVAIELGYDNQKISQLARSVIDVLKNTRKYTDAALLLEQFAENHKESIAVLIEGQEWDAAIRMIHKYNCLDLIENQLKPALVENYYGVLETIRNIQLDFELKSKRLKIVREKKTDSELLLVDEVNQFDDACSDISAFTASSVASKGNTGSISTRMSKSKKQTKKKYSLKEGSHYEDLALITALMEMINNIEIVKTDIKKLMKSLILFEYDKESSILQRELEDLTELIEREIPNIWPSEESTTSLGFGPSLTANKIAAMHTENQHNLRNLVLDPELKYPPKRNNVEWKLKLLN